MPQRKAERERIQVRPSPAPRKKWVFRLILLLFPLLVVFAAEAILRLANYGIPTSFFVKSKNGDAWISNENFASQFFSRQTTSRPVYTRLPLAKAPNAIRIFVLGESAAMGTPDPAFGFCRMLELSLQRQYPEKRIEVINAAMRGIDSHVIRIIARDCAHHEPDLFVVYMGNNDVIGLHGPEPGASRLSQWLPLIRVSHAVKSSRLGQLAKNLFRRNQPPEEQTMAYFRSKRLRADDPSREAVLHNFRKNLHDISRYAKTVVATVPVNLKDFPPLGSLHRAGLTDAQLAEWNAAYQRGDLTNALRIDDHYAELHFRLGAAQLAGHQTTNARHHFEQACRWDALQFRADRRLNDVIREIGSRFNFVDVERQIAAVEDGIPGARLFRDHVHPTFTGDFLIATNLFPKVLAALEGKSVTPRSFPNTNEVAAALGYTDWHDAQMQRAMADLMSRPPYHDQLNYAARQATLEADATQRLAKLGQTELQRSLDAALAAIQRKPDDWMLRLNYASMCQAMGQPARGIEHLQHVVRMFPESATFRIQLAQALLKAGRNDAAHFELREAAKLAPGHPQLPPTR